MKYQDVKLTEEYALKIIDIWRAEKGLVDFCENHHGVCYWNKNTGEILWYSGDGEEDESNGCLILNDKYPNEIKMKLK